MKADFKEVIASLERAANLPTEAKIEAIRLALIAICEEQIQIKSLSLPMETTLG